MVFQSAESSLYGGSPCYRTLNDTPVELKVESGAETVPCLTFRHIFNCLSNFGRPGNRSGCLGDLVSGPGSIPGPGEGLLRGLWTQKQNNKNNILLLVPKRCLRFPSVPVGIGTFNLEISTLVSRTRLRRR